MKTSASRDGTLKNPLNNIVVTPQYFHTIPTSCAILPTIHGVCYLASLFSCLKVFWGLFTGYTRTDKINLPVVMTMLLYC